jgi:hypothetical protein
MTQEKVKLYKLSLISKQICNNWYSDCTVYTNWNDLKPIQRVIPTGSGEGVGAERGGGIDDYSTWTYTYSEDYHLITEGVNELTSKISCENSPSNNITKSYSVNVTGVGIEQLVQQQQQQQTQGQKPTSEEQGEGETTATTKKFTTASLSTTPEEINQSRTYALFDMVHEKGRDMKRLANLLMAG